jgi:hypothetical protein
MFGGTAEAVRRWAELYYQVLEEYADRQWFVGKDQNMMNSLCLEHRGTCTLVEPSLSDSENPWFSMWGCLHCTRESLFFY